MCECVTLRRSLTHSLTHSLKRELYSTVLYSTLSSWTLLYSALYSTEVLDFGRPLFAPSAAPFVIVVLSYGREGGAVSENYGDSGSLR